MRGWNLWEPWWPRWSCRSPWERVNVTVWTTD